MEQSPDMDGLERYALRHRWHPNRPHRPHAGRD